MKRALKKLKEHEQIRHTAYSKTTSNRAQLTGLKEIHKQHSF
jgi:hypothetical protein